jgi:hypothetical protein
MSKLFSFMIGGGLILGAIAAVSIYNVDAHQHAGFIQISVLAKNQANYGIDQGQMVIPAVSMSIIEDKVRDIQGSASVPVIRYTSLPAQDPKTEEPGPEDQESVKEIKHNNGNGQGNHGDNGNHGSNSNEGGNGNNNDHGNTNKNKDEDRRNNNKEDLEAKGKDK